jgi:hypothetical protein
MPKTGTHHIQGQKPYPFETLSDQRKTQHLDTGPHPLSPFE